jgi:adenylate kinase
MHRRGKVVILLGPPGSGKGTQAARLSAALGIPAISTGEMLRRECQSGSSLGKAVQNTLASGQLVSDDVMNQVVAGRLGQEDCRRGCILDGYPRTVTQARFLRQLLRSLNMSRPAVFNFEIECEDVIARLSRRRQCAECGRIITVDANSRAAELVCDRDGSRFVERADDSPATIRERLKLYQQNAGELTGYYAKHDLHGIRATGTPEQISDEVVGILRPRAVAAAVGNRARALVRPQYHAQPA